MMKPSDLRFFLDSGAFSVWTRNAVIDLDEYCEFIRNNIEYLDAYASLDVVPGVPGRVATPKEREQAARQSWENYLYMVEAGLDPLPVYHYGEDPKWLKNMLDNGCSYIGIGGLKGTSSVQKKLWLDRVFSTLCDANGEPRVKTHGFGMTAIALVFRYPWYSVDSTSWIQASMVGKVYLPASDGNKFVFDRPPTTVAVSDKSPDLTTTKHANSFGKGGKALLLKWLQECGKTFEQVSIDYRSRATCNAYFFKQVAEKKKNTKFMVQAGKSTFW